jgi:hypothetical protein
MRRVLIPFVIVAGLLGGPVHATVTQEQIVAELRAEGYTRIEIRRTLLGRTRITATSPIYDREIILNPATGVIMRDLLRVRSGGGGSSNNAGGSGQGSGGGSGSGTIGGGGGGGGSSDDNDDDDDDDDSDDDDDDSGGSSGGDDGDDDDDD